MNHCDLVRFQTHRLWGVFIKLGVPPNTAKEWLARTEEDRALKMARCMYVQFGGFKNRDGTHRKKYSELHDSCDN